MDRLTLSSDKWERNYSLWLLARWNIHLPYSSYRISGAGIELILQREKKRGLLRNTYYFLIYDTLVSLFLYWRFCIHPPSAQKYKICRSADIWPQKRMHFSVTVHEVTVAMCWSFFSKLYMPNLVFTVKENGLLLETRHFDFIHSRVYEADRLKVHKKGILN